MQKRQENLVQRDTQGGCAKTESNWIQAALTEDRQDPEEAGCGEEAFPWSKQGLTDPLTSNLWLLEV